MAADTQTYRDLDGTSPPRTVLTVSLAELLADSGPGSVSSTFDGNFTTGNGSLADPPGELLPFDRSLPAMIIIGLILALVILLTIGGNLLVCITIATNKKLQTCTHYFVLGLAMTDLLLGSLVLPFSAIITITVHWPLGPVFCNIYNSTDVMLCTVSILTLFAISLDRYFAVTTPLRYQQRMNGRIVCKVMAGIGAFSFLMAFIPIHLGWNSPSGKVQNHDYPSMCVFELNKPYVLLVSLGTYFAPLLIMCGVYMRVLQITRHQVKEINKITKSGASAAMLTRSSRDETASLDSQNGRHIIVHKAQNGRETISRNGTSPGTARERRNREHKNRVVSDTKATVTLASVVLAFAICWVPYFVLFTAKAFLQGEVNVHLDLFALWLGYVNSSINPFLYAFYNSAFREGFVKILCRRWPSRDQRTMHTLAVRVHRNNRHGSSSETSELSVFRQTS